jgi:hypothetical protein
MRPARTPSRREHWLVRLRLSCKPRVVRKALLAAGVVGTLLVLLNQGDLLLSGEVTRRVLVKSLLTPIMPFCVTMLGAFLNTGTAARAEDLRPGRAAIRRSVLIALGVGSTIIVLNQGDVLLAGAIPPPGAREGAGDTLRAFLCVPLWSLCRLSERPGRTAERHRNNVESMDDGCAIQYAEHGSYKQRQRGGTQGVKSSGLLRPLPL